MDKKQFLGTLSIAESVNPLQTNLEFIFTDFVGNANKQGIPKEEAENIIQTGMYMPVKVNYKCGKVAGHSGAEPIGPMVELENRDDKVIGKAILWRDEYNDVDTYLREAFAEDKNAIQFSWEVYHTDSEIDESGIEWLKGCVVAGITIVENPAYQGRTPLLALSEEKENMEELEQLKAELEVANSKIAELETVVQTTQAYVSEIEELRDQMLEEVASLREYKKSAEQAQLIANRKSAIQVVGIEDFEKRQEFYCSMDQDIFDQYVADLLAVKNTKVTSSTRVELPEQLNSDKESLSLQEIVKSYKEVVRGN